MTHDHPELSGLLALCLLGSALPAGCASRAPRAGEASAGTAGFDAPSTAFGGSSSATSGSGPAGHGLPISLGGAGPSNSGGNGPISPGAECAKGTAVAEPIPSVLQLVVDISGSMNWVPGADEEPMNGEQSKWDVTREALKAAVADLPASTAIGLSLFPNNPRFGECIRNRVEVPIDLLGAVGSVQRARFGEALDEVDPGDGTPTHAAFLFGAQTVAASSLPGKKFVLLITDGVPTWTVDCGGNGGEPVDNAELIAAVGETFAQGGISTFVIGSPGSEDARADLSQMASQGGTARSGCSDAGPNFCHLDMTSAPDFAAALAQGLADVAGVLGTCEYAVPSAPPGLEVDPRLVNVLFTRGDGTQTSIPKDAVGDCASGWKYDSEAAPTKITLCGSDCTAVEADTLSSIDILFGCSTETNVK